MLQDINLMHLGNYNVAQAVMLLAHMVACAPLLRRAGFLAATFLFLVVGSLILGERRITVVMLVAAIAAGSVWYPVVGVLGIFPRPRPLPMFMTWSRRSRRSDDGLCQGLHTCQHPDGDRRLPDRHIHRDAARP